MSIRRNAIANYVSQTYVMIVGIIMTPLYVKYMGVEAFGLIGFYATLQALFQLLDMGLAPTMTRESARYRGGATNVLSLRRLLRVLECIFVPIALLGAASMILSSKYIVENWLKVGQISVLEVHRSILLISIIVVLRWLCVLYRGVVNGFEQFVWLSRFNMIVATFRFVMVLPLLIFVSATPSFYFGYQLVIAIAELLLLVSKSYRLLPEMRVAKDTEWDWNSLREVLKFSVTIGITSIIGILATQVDKILLSHLLSLTDYGYFTLAVLAAGGVMIAGSPIGAVLLPRLTKLNAEGDLAALSQLYRTATQLVGVIAIPVALVMAFFSEQVLWVWTGDANTARIVAPTMTLFAIGNGLYIYAAFPYYLQFAKGNLKLHVISSISFLVIFIPLLLWMVKEYGVKGAGFAWIIANLIPLAIWSPVVHRRFVDGLHLKWMLQDIAPIAAVSLGGTFVLYKLVNFPHERVYVAFWIVLISVTVALITAVGSSWVRSEAKRRLARNSRRKEILFL